MPWAAELYEQMRREGLLDKVQRLSLPPPVGDVQIETGMIGFESPRREAESDLLPFGEGAGQ